MTVSEGIRTGRGGRRAMRRRYGPVGLPEDIDGLAVWSVGYEAPISRWRGTMLSALGRCEEALTAATEAAGLYRDLARTDGAPPCRDARAVTVSSGTRRSGLRLLRNEPLVNLLAIPERDAGLLGEVGQHLFEIADTVRRARHVGMHAECHDPRGLFAFAVEAIECIDRTPQHGAGFVLAAHHDGDVINLDRIGQRDERPGLGADPERLVIE